MGFISFMGRMIQGKPAFEMPKPDVPPYDPSAPVPPVIDAPIQPVAAGPKVIPVVTIDRTLCDQSGTHMEVHGHIYNHSKERIHVDKIRVFNQTVEVDRYLRPGEVHDYRLYSGERLPNTSLHSADLIYRNDAGDYFCANHFIDFKLESDNTYSVRQFRVQMPIRDV